MLTFKEFLLEAKINPSSYGSWINPDNTIIDVSPNGGHADAIRDWGTDEGIKDDDLIMKTYTWAFDNNWVRITHNKWKSLSVQGSEKNIKKIWKHIRGLAMKSNAVFFDVIPVGIKFHDTTRQKHHFFELPQQKRELMQAMQKGF
tara:strand:- start:3984 stop:4418 length:435 start_codon:yes stop_codon:yes gene_type:complete